MIGKRNNTCIQVLLIVLLLSVCVFTIFLEYEQEQSFFRLQENRLNREISFAPSSNRLSVSSQDNSYFNPKQTSNMDNPTFKRVKSALFKEKNPFSAFRRKNGENPFKIAAAAIDASDNIVVVGTTNSYELPISNAYQGEYHGRNDPFITKFSANGESLIFSTYFGGWDPDWATDVAIDAEDNIVVVGGTFSPNFPTLNAYQPDLLGVPYYRPSEAFIAKFSANGTLIFSTFLGGTTEDHANGVAVDTEGNIVVTGYCQSRDFPIENAYQTGFFGKYEGFVTKFSPDGQSLIFSTYLGGDYEDSGLNVVCDNTSNVIVTGYTNSPNFPTQNAFQLNYTGGLGFDTFVTKFSPDGQSLVFSTYLGGHGTEYGINCQPSIIVDAEDNIIATGQTTSTDFPTVNAIQANTGGGLWDAYTAKFDVNGSMVFSTYLGASGVDGVCDACVDVTGNIILTGQTSSIDFPIVNAYQGSYGGGHWDAFITKFSPDGQSLIFSTYLGGSDTDYTRDITVDFSGDVIVTGHTFSGNFPIVNGSEGTRRTTFPSATFITKFNANGQSVLLSLFFGNPSETLTYTYPTIPTSTEVSTIQTTFSGSESRTETTSLNTQHSNTATISTPTFSLMLVITALTSLIILTTRRKK
ncbi:MAG: SBBP repeat-containing protein [Candidatus Hodarchaeota archaeon]